MSDTVRVLLGPQRPASNLAAAVDAIGAGGAALASISAGWQEAEGDIDDVRALAGCELQDLQLYGRAEQIFHTHPELHDAYRARQEQLKEQQRLYRLRLRHLMMAARQVLRSDGDPTLLAAEQRHAIAQLRALDRHHGIRVESIYAAFESKYAADSFPPLAEHRDAIIRILDATAGVLITGGNLIVLLNRLRLFGLRTLLENRPVVAWSAGAMALAETIVLYHDRLPEGRRDAELLGAGLGLIREFVVLPDAARRLRDKDSARVSAMARRFSPATCALLDPGSLLQITGTTVSRADGVGRIKTTGAIGQVRAK